MKKLSLLAFAMLTVFACTKAVDEEPIELNQKGLCFEDSFGNGCGPGLDDPGDDDNGGSGSGGGGTGGGNTAPPPPLGDHLIAFMKGENSNNVNAAISTNSPSAWQNYGGTPSAWNTGEGPGAVLFNDEVYMFHSSNSSQNVIQSHAEFNTGGTLTWQTSNSNISLGNGARTNQAISAAVWKDRIFVASRSINNDAIYVSRSLLNDGTQYESTAELAVTESENDGGYESTWPFDDKDGWPPYLTVYQDKLYIFWVKRTTNSVFYKVKETLTGSWGPRVEVTGTIGGQRKEAEEGVAAAEHDGKLYITYPLKDDGSIMTRQVLPAAPGIQTVTDLVGADTNTRPSMVSDGTNLVVIYREKGSSDSNDIYYSYKNSLGNWVNDTKARGSSNKAPYVIYVNGN